MLINATVSISLTGGMILHGDSGSALITLNPIASINPKAQLQASGQMGLGGGMSMNLNAKVTHQGEVDINAPPS